MKSVKMGIGYDIHKLVKNRKLILAGVDIQFKKGLDGWSDADCLTHSIIDAMLGAAGKGDIGRNFGTNRPENKGVSSLKLLGRTLKIIKGYKVNNIDCTVLCEAPRLSPYIAEMKKNISRVLNVPDKNINIKTTTAKKMGPVGRSQAIASFSIVSLIK